MLPKSIRYRILLAFSSFGYVVLSFASIAIYLGAKNLSAASILYFAALSALYLAGANYFIGRHAKRYRFDFHAAQEDGESYRQALIGIGRVPLKAFLAFIPASALHAAVVNFTVNSFGMAGDIRLVFCLFQISLCMVGAAFFFVLSDQLVLLKLRESRLLKYPTDYDYGRQVIKTFVIPMAITVTTLLFSVTLAVMVLSSGDGAGSGIRVYVKPGFLIPQLFFFAVIGVLVYLWSGENKAIFRRLIDQMGKLDSGEKDLTGRVDVLSVDEFGLISGMINGFCAGLQRSMAELKGAQGRLSSLGRDLEGNAQASSGAILQIASSVDDVVERVTGQSASVVESSAAIEQIAKNIESMDSLVAEQFSSVTRASASIEEMVANIASITSSIEKLADRYSELTAAAGVGERAQSGSAERIRLISERSQALLEANKVVAHIASQTNLLAMNAAIEAAHAGDAGRGFSVVADEIRHLAETSANQSKTIKKEIGEVQRAIQEVVAASTGSSQAFGTVARLIGEMDILVRETHDALREQREGSMQVLEALKSMNEITSQVRDGSREMSLGNATVLDEIGRLQDNTARIKEALDRAAEGAKDIRSHAEKVAELAKGTRDTIQTMDAAIGSFRT